MVLGGAATKKFTAGKWPTLPLTPEKGRIICSDSSMLSQFKGRACTFDGLKGKVCLILYLSHLLYAIFGQDI